LPDNCSDEELVIAMQKGDRSAMGICYSRYSKSVYQRARWMLKEDQGARDVTHDVFIKAMLNIAQIREAKALSAWLQRMTYFHCLTLIKRSGRMEFHEPSDKILENANAIDESELQEELSLKIEALGEHVSKLKEEERLLLLMVYESKMTYQEVADTLKIGLSAVKMRLSRLRDKLHDALTATNHE